MSQLYLTAKQFLQQHPGAGKGLLARHLGIKTPAARRLIERYRGETQGHNPDAEYQRVLALKLQHPQLGSHALAKQLGITVDKARLHLARYEGAQVFHGTQLATMFAPAPPNLFSSDPPATAPADDAKQAGVLNDSARADGRDLSYVGHQVQSAEELLRYADVDGQVWEIERQALNKWDVGTKDPQTGAVLTSPLFQVKVWLRRRVVEQRLATLMNGLLDAFKVAAPPARVIARPPAGDGLFEIAIPDLHFGKFCWAAEVHEPYDMEIAARTFRTALDDLLSKGAALKPACILFPVGNDFFNTDNLEGTTTKGTPQDEEGRWQASFIAGRKLIVEAIESCRAVAEVRVCLVEGNHDQQRILYLGEVLAAWFRHAPDVTVDHAPTQRKYVRWHHNLIGLTHGCAEPHANLPLIMATERAADWAAAAHREWQLGHLHARAKKVYQPMTDQQGVLVRIIPSLSAGDAWHRSKGYQGARAAQAFYFDPTAGCVAEFSHNV
ncbi:MAG: hypothetical protein ABMA26_09300 [Limisphaerales bacterium]